MTYSRRTWVNGNVWDQTAANDFEGRVESEFTSQDSRITTNTSGVASAATHAALTTTAHGGIVASTSPRLLAGGGSTGQVLAKASGTDYDTVWSSLGLPQLVTSLPGSPVDGQEIYFQADATNGVIWHLRYRSASASTYKWEFVGGSPLISEVDASETTSLATYVALTTAGPSVTVPLAGDFIIEIGARISSASSNEYGYMSFDVGGTAATDADAIFNRSDIAGGGGAFASVMRQRRKTGLAAATALVSKYKQAGAAGAVGFEQRFMSVRPVRVG